METQENLDRFYERPDPWEFQTNRDDAERKRRILGALQPLRFDRALDLGAGEGWITKDLPADVRHAYELSAVAKSRLPQGVTGVETPDGEYDLVVATGVLYPQYDCGTLFRIMREHASDVILTCSIEAWEHPDVRYRWNDLSFLAGKEIVSETFPYRKFVQRLRVFKLK